MNIRAVAEKKGNQFGGLVFAAPGMFCGARIAHRVRE